MALHYSLLAIRYSLLAVLLLAAEAHAQSWPQRTVRLILPLGPGSATDVTARLYAERLAVLAQALGVSADYLLGLPPPESSHAA